MENLENGEGQSTALRHNAHTAGSAGSRSRLQPATCLLLRLPDTRGSAKGRGTRSCKGCRSCSHGEREAGSARSQHGAGPPGQLLSAAGPLLSTEASRTRHRPGGFVVQGRGAETQPLSVRERKGGRGGSRAVGSGHLSADKAAAPARTALDGDELQQIAGWKMKAA